MMPNLQKPEPRARTKRRKVRSEEKREQQIRAACVERDGDCRLNDPALWLMFGACSGESEWAHLPESRRSKTLGLPPEERHQTSGTLMLCTRHHDRLDGRARPRLDIQPATSHGADGPLGITNGQTTYIEERKDLAWRNRVN